jgi:GTP cyclohydrolase I
MNTRDQHALLRGAMPDVQGSADVRQQAIQRVGVKGVRYPIRWRTADGGEQPGVGSFNLYVALPAEQKGTHMSRFIELLEGAIAPGRPALDAAAMRRLHAEMLSRLDAADGLLEVSFALFVRKAAPVSGVESLLDYEVTMSVDGTAEAASLILSVVAPVKSLCPCSKSIADYGAHNQRSHVTITVHSDEPITPEALLRVAEEEASSEIYGLLKRVDEKYITERAYDNPKFVEDLVRDVAARLKADARIAAFTVEAENFESIHNHSAYARIDHPLPA